MQHLILFFKTVVFVWLLTLVACQPCKDSSCQNAGSCAADKCKCPSPYGGVHCEIDLCSGTNCGLHGNCYYGSCICAAGYEGPQCENLVTEKFVGAFATHTSCPNSSTNYSTVITAYSSPASREIRINPILGFSLFATVNGRTIIAGSQEVNNTIYSARGSISENGKKIDLTVTIDPYGTAPAYTCQFTFTK